MKVNKFIEIERFVLYHETYDSATFDVLFVGLYTVNLVVVSSIINCRSLLLIVEEPIN